MSPHQRRGPTLFLRGRLRQADPIYPNGGLSSNGRDDYRCASSIDRPIGKGQRGFVAPRRREKPPPEEHRETAFKEPPECALIVMLIDERRRRLPTCSAQPAQR
jgi:transcription termination factor Rho